MSDEQKILRTLRTINVFINMGSDWMPPVPGDDGLASSISEHWADAVSTQSDWDSFLGFQLPHSSFSKFDDGILANCFEKTVLLVPDPYRGNPEHDDSPFDPIPYRKVRKAWGRICKTIITKASQSLSRGMDADDRATVEAALSSVFRRLVYQVNHHWHRAGIVGWWALEAIGHLLLSAGIMPGDETMQGWERILKREYEAPDIEMKRTKDCEAPDGNESDSAFLLAGVNAEETKDD